jgi:hypothetical protein
MHSRRVSARIACFGSSAPEYFVCLTVRDTRLKQASRYLNVFPPGAFDAASAMAASTTSTFNCKGADCISRSSHVLARCMRECPCRSLSSSGFNVTLKTCRSILSCHDSNDSDAFPAAGFGRCEPSLSRFTGDTVRGWTLIWGALGLLVCCVLSAPLATGVAGFDVCSDGGEGTVF